MHLNHIFFKRLAVFLFSLVGLCVLGACKPGLSRSPVAEAQELERSVARHYADLVYANYQDALEAAREMRRQIVAFLDAPDATRLEAARQAWLAARPAYLQTEVFRFYGGPIDADEGGVEPFLNAWPMDEAYLDYVKGDAAAGIIQNPGKFPDLNRHVLMALNEKDGEENISTGYHAIEFLLWGQDLDLNQPGQRPFTDYVPSTKGPGRFAVRRATYLREVTDLLVAHLEELTRAWEPGSEQNYRAKFLALPPREAVEKILTGMAVLSGFELSGERLVPPYESQAREDEHSCFSDNTHVDMIYNAVGIENVWTGRYTRSNGQVLQGPGMREVVAAQNPELAAKLDRSITESVRLTRAIPVPFEQAILGDDNAPGRRVIAELIASLRLQAAQMVQAGELLGLKIDISGGEKEDVAHDGTGRP
jgi:putative iron-regulated protein